MKSLEFVFAHIVSMLVAEPRDDEGATAVEYAMVIGLVSIVVVAAVVLFGDKITSFVSTVTFK